MPDHPFKWRLVQQLIALYPSEHITFKISTLGGIIGFKKNDYIANHLLEHGRFESKTLQKVIEIMGKGNGLFLDIGANAGLYACVVGMQKKPVIAIEAHPFAFLMLHQNVHQNNMQSHVACYLGAVHHQYGSIQFHTPDQYNLGTNRYAPDIGADGYWITSIALNDLLQQVTKEYKTSIRLMKLDIEGSEWEVLRGLDFDRYGPSYIILEFEPQNNKDIEKVIPLLRQKGYRFFNMDGMPLNEPMLNLPENNLLAIRI